METSTLSGFARKNCHVPTVVTEHSNRASAKLGVCPRVVSLSENEFSQRVPVRVFNMSAKVLEIKPKDVLCDLHEAKVLRNASSEAKEKHTDTKQKEHVCFSFASDDAFLSTLECVI